MFPTLRFLKEHFRPSPDAVLAEETSYRRGAETLPATLYVPAGARGVRPAWVALHGITLAGREHPSLVAFARALAASGARVLVPDVPEWRALRIAPAVSEATIRDSVLAMSARDDVADHRVGLIGFSFGATQALIAAADPALAGRLAGVAAWGGYHDVHRLFRFGLTGRHEHRESRYRVEPDPYGRWVMGANYLTEIPGHGGDGRVAAALRRLAEEAGRRRVFAGDPLYDPLKAELRAGLDPAEREVYDLFAAPTTATPDYARGEPLAERLADAAVRCDPLIDPGPHLARVDVPVVLAHARDDRLVPFTESYRLATALPSGLVRGPSILSLFSHSGGPHEALGPVGVVREACRFAFVLRRILASV